MGNQEIIEQKQIRKQFISDLRDKFFAGEGHLSYSSLSAFRKSPKHFIDYKIGKKEDTDAMKLGSLVHLLILEPEKFDKKYLVCPKCDKRTKEGKEIYANYLIQLGDRTEIKFEDFETAALMADAVKNNPVAKSIMDQANKREFKVEFSHKGLKFVAYIDGIGKLIFDIKICTDAEPRKFQRDIVNMGYWLQSGVYTFAVEEMLPYFLIAVDRNCNVSVHKIMDDFVEYGQQQFDLLCNQFIECLESNSFEQSFEYKSVLQQGYFPMDKPPYQI